MRMKVAVVSLIFKSVKYAEFVYNSFLEHTKRAEFWFIANDANTEVIRYLHNNTHNYLIHENPDIKGTQYPHNISGIYKAWNRAREIPVDILVFVNSDMQFSRFWLNSLIKNLRADRIICSRLVESGKMPSGKYGISKDFGRSPDTFRKEDFEVFAESNKEDRIMPGGLYMPCAMYRDVFVKSGGYPLGNPSHDGIQTSGDKYFFHILGNMGVNHYTAFDSIVYHVQEGEVDYNVD